MDREKKLIEIKNTNTKNFKPEFKKIKFEKLKLVVGSIIVWPIFPIWAWKQNSQKIKYQKMVLKKIEEQNKDKK